MFPRASIAWPRAGISPPPTSLRPDRSARQDRGHDCRRHRPRPARPRRPRTLRSPRAPRAPRAPRPRALAALGATAAVALLTLGPLAAPAAADAPLRLGSPVTDLTSGSVVGSISGAESAIRQLASDGDYQLWAVYVDSFDGADGVAWADETADLSGLGDDHLLLAVAVEDREFGLSATDTVGDSTYNRAFDAAEGALRDAADGDGDWAQATIDTADALRGSSGGIRTPLLIGGVIAVGTVVGFGVYRSTRRDRGAGQAQGAAGEPTKDLVARCGPALVEIDDDVREFEQDLGFAQAQFGDEATRQFAAALTQAKGAVGQAFALRKQLDDIPEGDDAARRATATQILQLCHAVQTDLSSRAQAFDALRQEQANAPQALEDLGRRVDELRGRVEPARATLANLAVQYPPTALASVSANPDHASQLLEGAYGSLVTGRQHVEQGELASAVAQAHVARDALTQATALLAGVENAQRDLAEASARLQQASASLSSDVADADRLAPGDPALAPSPQPHAPLSSRPARPPSPAATRSARWPAWPTPRPRSTPRSPRAASRPRSRSGRRPRSVSARPASRARSARRTSTWTRGAAPSGPRRARGWPRRSGCSASRARRRRATRSAPSPRCSRPRRWRARPASWRSPTSRSGSRVRAATEAATGVATAPTAGWTWARSSSAGCWATAARDGARGAAARRGAHRGAAAVARPGAGAARRAAAPAAAARGARARADDARADDARADDARAEAGVAPAEAVPAVAASSRVA
ncbi:TPM domain-containing protein [Litorihabitans aurantiacus]|uniref:TPM domain-containing protein n=1 Tax=Litorihabitans aurantiacus TaxID=1930061 RepID=A0AA37ULS6_9MICO|nr:TPM domain-containing protein [Litorihabitans aurantiacus]GMA30364.1 hypothetical protein GCM10025875_03560 [Litorihabitans aurantiacus]